MVGVVSRPDALRQAAHERSLTLQSLEALVSLGMEVTIGQLSRLTGLPVKTIRYYAEIGLVPEVSRSPSGYRRYDETSLARLELVRALRDLGMCLEAVRKVAEQRSSLQEMARAQAEAIDVQVHRLTLRRAVLRALARGIGRPEEVGRMTEFAKASADESRRIMEEFLAAAFEDHEDDPFASRMRGALPALPDEPSQDQIDAWVELAEMVGDPAFRARVRQMVAEGSRQRAASGLSEQDADTQAAGWAVVSKAGSAAASGIRADSSDARSTVDELVQLFAKAAKRQADAAYRRDLLAQLEQFSDGRVERYWQLIGIINGWPEQPSMMPAYEWLIAALRARG
jgi:DNA-binding transcriptional MerR regulator